MRTVGSQCSFLLPKPVVDEDTKEDDETEEDEEEKDGEEKEVEEAGKEAVKEGNTTSKVHDFSILKSMKRKETAEGDRTNRFATVVRW